MGIQWSAYGAFAIVMKSRRLRGSDANGRMVRCRMKPASIKAFVCKQGVRLWSLNDPVPSVRHVV